MVDFYISNCCVKETAFRSFYDSNNCRDIGVGMGNRFIRKKIYLNDGNHFSVQAGLYLYSSPNVYSEKYKAFEVGFPSFDVNIGAKDEEVYGYVPFGYIIHLIFLHGGIEKYDD